MDKRYRELKRAIKPYGYKLVLGKRHHKVVNEKTGHRLTCSGSPTRVKHWIANVISDIKKYGGVK